MARDRDHTRHRAVRRRSLRHTARRRLRRARRRLPRRLRVLPLGPLGSLAGAALVAAALLPRLGGGTPVAPRPAPPEFEAARSGAARGVAVEWDAAPSPILVYLVSSPEAADARRDDLEASLAAQDGLRVERPACLVLVAGTAQTEAEAREILVHVDSIRRHLNLPGVSIVDLRGPADF